MKPVKRPWGRGRRTDVEFPLNARKELELRRRLRRIGLVFQQSVRLREISGEDLKNKRVADRFIDLVARIASHGYPPFLRAVGIVKTRRGSLRFVVREMRWFTYWEGVLQNLGTAEGKQNFGYLLHVMDRAIRRTVGDISHYTGKKPVEVVDEIMKRMQPLPRNVGKPRMTVEQRTVRFRQLPAWRMLEKILEEKPASLLGYLGIQL